ncbi:MAG: tRNA (N6-isopentenyl adenosine(37)-C2)-methylthiotransferase MiaB [Myxococcales bacterium]|jgi:tRNA-2-methylthio-N6-dimethylallyladenosine synthase
MTKRVHIQTFGCQMNVHDSRRIEEVLAREGYEATADAEQADLLVFNTCSIREKAEHKLFSAVGTFRELKQRRPALVMAVAGCMAQEHGEKLLSRLPLVDVMVGPDNIPELPGLVRAAEGGGPPRARTEFDLEDPSFLRAQPRPDGSEVSAYVTTMKGCDERCTYCIVPYTRGSERYRAADDIVAEVAALARGGVREVTLLGQTVNSWHDPRQAGDAAGRPGESRFAELLQRIASEVPGLDRLRYTSPHPRHVTPALVRAHAELSLLPAHVHLPVQSGSDRVLRRMLRRYGRDEFIERAAALRAARPDFTLSTDIIVGFPGETEEDFEQTLSLVREVGFVAAFCFKYSPRPYTPALKLGDDVPEAVKSERLTRLFEVVEAQQQEHLRSLVGSETHVLFEGPSKAGEGRFSGRSDRHEVVHAQAPAGHDLTGQLLRVRIAEANRHSLHGELIDPPPAAVRPPTQPRGAVRLPVVDT